MDGTTEPVVAVIGHPIAGNPSQFAFERALSAMQLDWRVISFDVPPGEIAAALDGAEVLGMRGILIDSSVRAAASKWYGDRQPDAGQIDCLYRVDEGRFAGCSEQRGWIDQQLADHQKKLGRELVNCLWLGDQVDPGLVDAERFAGEPLTAAPELDEIGAADVIVIATVQGVPTTLEVDDWPPGQTNTLVIDLTEGHPDLEQLKQLGYQVLTLEQRRIETLGRCLLRWTGADPPEDVIRDAIEEYLAV